MKRLFLLGAGLGVAAAVLLTGSATPARAQDMQQTVQHAADILSARQGSSDPIPPPALAAALGVAIIDVTKGGLVVGASGGEGIVLMRAPGAPGRPGGWSAPIPIGLGGVTFGAQAGGANTKAIILLNSARAVRAFTNDGKIAWNASASGTAGTTSETEQANRSLSDADVAIYRDTGGLYGGAVLGGSGVRVQEDKIRSTYGPGVTVRDLMEGRMPPPPYCAPLFAVLGGA